MKKKVGFLEKLSSGKGFYVTCALSVLTIFAAIAVIYNSSMNMLKGIVIPNTTAQVQKNQQGVSDPREKEKTTEKKNTKPEPTEEKSTNEPSRVITTVKATEPTAAENLSYVMPVDSEITKAFSMNPVFDKTMEDWRSHGGTDYSAPKGTEVKAVGNGVVSKVISDPNWGFIVELDCGDFVARYCGLEQGTTVTIGEVVEQGQTVGKTGSIPCESKEDEHFHFEILVSGDRVDPEKALKE